MLRIRTGYSFHTAFGHLEDVAKQLADEPFWPITDRNSTFGFNRWSKLAKKHKKKPVFGVELAVTPRLGDNKPTLDFWTFIAKDDIKFINQLVSLATSNPGKEPSLTYEQAQKAEGVFKIAGERCQLQHMQPADDLFIALSPALPRGLYNAAKEQFNFAATSDNLYPSQEDKELYRIALGRRANTQTYPQWILNDQEWDQAIDFATEDEKLRAIENSKTILEHSSADLKKATLLVPEKPKTLEQLCVEGAVKLNCNLDDPVYKARLEKELKLIAEKQFEDYFFIIADLVNWAKERMIVGPARGSSCGSLVCYLLGITSVDPIPYGLIFERFIDVQRADLPDIDIDFSDARRELVFNYAESKYGKHRVARLGTVGMFKPKSAIKQAASQLRVPGWKVDKVIDNIIVRSSGDSRAMQQLEDTLNDTEAGRNLIKDHPEIKIAGKMEGHPNNASQHAAGIVLTEKPINEYVAIDEKTGAAMCDKKDAEDLNLLKIDALGLTQLSIFERTLQLLGKTDTSASRFFETIPLNDQKAFDVLNKGHFSGVFQFMGGALKSLTKQIDINKLDDLVNITALARPGPMASGGANEWVKRRNGQSKVSYPHPEFEKHLAETLGIVIFQETVMNIGREVGDLSWDDVTQLRKSMSKSLGKEYFDQFGDRWKAGAVKKGIPAHTLEKIWNDLTSMGAWCLDGKTKLRNPFPNQFSKKEFTLEQLFEAGGLAPEKRQQGSAFKHRRQSLFCWDGTGIKPKPTLAIVKGGKKKVYEVKTASGKKIVASADHSFLRPTGFYKKLKEMQVGELVMVFGDRQLSPRKAKTGVGQGAHNHKALVYKGKGGTWHQAMQRDKICCRCKRRKTQEIHHINMDHKDHRLKNLMGLCRVCHKLYHREAGQVPKAWQRGWGIKSDAIVSIKPLGIRETYDIVMPAPHNNFLANDFVVHNSFNKSHAVAYGLVSYYCCYLKAHYPLEFAAATLDAESDPMRQIQLLRELEKEGIKYTPVDPDHSTDKWAIVDGRLIGPLTNIKGIGPATVAEILENRKNNTEIRMTLRKKLERAKTPIDSLYPVREKIMNMDLAGMNIFSKPNDVIDVQCGLNGEVMILAVAKKIAPRDENEAVNIAKRGGRVLSGPTKSLNLFFQDDTDEIFCKIDRFKFERLGAEVVERGKAGKALYAVKGTVPKDFRMISVSNIRYLGDLDA